MREVGSLPINPPPPPGFAAAAAMVTAASAELQPELFTHVSRQGGEGGGPFRRALRARDRDSLRETLMPDQGAYS